MTQPWQPECTEDELLVAVVVFKRALHAGTVGTDPGIFPVLHWLASSGPSRQGPLADGLGLDVSTVSRHVRTLVRDGLVEAHRDPDDGRATLLTVTEAGRRRLAERLAVHRARLRAATATFTPQERAELVRLLHKLADNLGGPEESS